MTRVVTSYNNFARAKVDHDLMGRYDLPLYQSGADIFENFISNFKGNAIFRAGFESLVKFQDCVFVVFKFNPQQSYLCVFYAGKIRFLSYDVNGNFGWVLNGGATPLEVDNPYTLAECRELDYTQDFDVMIVTHKDHQPRQLRRTSANSFTFLTFARKDDPFGLTYQATKTITAITQAANAVVTAAAHGYTTGDMVKLDTIVGMTQLNKYTARVTVLTVNTFSIDVDTTTFTAYGSSGTAAKVLTGDYPSCCLFYKARLFYAASRLKITTIWASESANYYIHTLPVTVIDTSALQFTIADLAQKIEWMFPGDNSLIVGSADGIVAVNGGGVGTPITAETVEANITSADGANESYPVRKAGLIFYAGFNARNLFFFSYDLLTESFKAEDANYVSYDITRGGLGRLEYKKDRNDLIFSLRGDGVLLGCNFDAKERIIGWDTQPTYGVFGDIAVMPDNTGAPQLFALTFRSGDYFIERQAEYVEFAERSMFFTEGDPDTAKDRKARDDEAHYRYVAEQLKECIYLDNAQVVKNLKTATITYNPGAGTITAGVASFVIGDIGKHIVYKTLTGYESGRFIITGYTSATVVTVAVLQEPTANVYSSWYLTFKTISGLTDYIGETIGVVTDGGYQSDFLVGGGASIELPEQVTHAVVGYKYTGVIKSFCLGFQAGAANTQTTMKAISRVGLRTVASAGGKFGSSLYKLEDFQEQKQGDLNYLPPLPIDGTKYITYVDDNEQDKYFFVVQNEPLPFQLTSAIIEANYTVGS